MTLTELLTRAREEIVSLRRANEILQAKCDMIDVFAGALFGNPARPQTGAMHPDVLFGIDQALQETPGSEPGGQRKEG